MSTIERPDSAQPKIFGVGLGRTGTLSLCHALQTLGFGPCLHTLNSYTNPDYYHKFIRAVEGGETPELLDEIYHEYRSGLDVTTAMLFESLYKAYPDAKFILTVRDIKKWAESTRDTLIVPLLIPTDQRKARLEAGTASEMDIINYEADKKLGASTWSDLYYYGYHGGRMHTDLEGEYLRHKQRVMEVIPKEQLLVFDVKDGWKPLVEFLGVPEPSEPFPHLNDAQSFKEMLAAQLQIQRSRHM